MLDLDNFSNICIYLKNKDVNSLLSINKLFSSYNRDELYMNIIIIYFKNIKLKIFNYKLNYRELYKELIVISKLQRVDYFQLPISKLWELFLYSINNLVVDVLIFTLSRDNIPSSKYISSINLLINNLSKYNINKTFSCFDVLINCYPGPINYKHDTYVKLIIKLISLNIGLNLDVLKQIDIGLLCISETIIDSKNKIIKKIINNDYSHELKLLLNINNVKYKFDVEILKKISIRMSSKPSDINIQLINYYITNLVDEFVFDYNVMKFLNPYTVIMGMILSLDNLKIYNINKLISYLFKNREEELLKLLFSRGHIKTLSPILIKKIKQHNFINILEL